MTPRHWLLQHVAVDVAADAVGVPAPVAAEVAVPVAAAAARAKRGNNEFTSDREGVRNTHTGTPAARGQAARDIQPRLGLFQ